MRGRATRYGSDSDQPVERGGTNLLARSMPQIVARPHHAPQVYDATIRVVAGDAATLLEHGQFSLLVLCSSSYRLRLAARLNSSVRRLYCIPMTRRHNAL